MGRRRSGRVAWRQTHTSITLDPAGQRADSRSYAFKFRWADDYDAVRRILVEEDQIDVHVVPGMTVPSNLHAQLALRCRREIEVVEAEFPQATKIEPLGKENDGGAGGGFEPAPTGRTWLGQPHHRGSWYYACEIDLGYCGALRSAATVLADDPLFGRFSFGGDWRKIPRGIEVVPKDGLRRRFRAVLTTGKLELEVEVGRFAASRPILLEEDLSGVRLALESDNPQAHSVKLHLMGFTPGEYAVTGGETVIATLQIEAGRGVSVEVLMEAGARPKSLAITRRNE